MIKKMITTKYIPKEFKELLIDNDLIKIIQNMNLNILLYGPPGSGKTSIIKALINENKSKYKIKVLNISDDRGIDLIRNDVLSFIDDMERKIVILDEMDSLTVDAQNMLNSILDAINTKYIFVCNYINNINQSIISKCCCLRINNIDNDKLIKRLKYILNKEQIYISNISLEFIINYYKKDIRKILNLFESIKCAYGTNKFINLKCIKEQIGLK